MCSLLEHTHFLGGLGPSPVHLAGTCFNMRLVIFWIRPCRTEQWPQGLRLPGRASESEECAGACWKTLFLRRLLKHRAGKVKVSWSI